jgi:hypothetical protein
MKEILMLVLLTAILQATAALAATPVESEFTSGSRTKFSTANHQKSNGINMVLSYPNSWLAEEGERPHIVQKFVSEGGRGLEMVSIIITDLNLPPGTVISQNELKEFFTPSEMAGMVPPGAKFIQAASTEIEATPAGILEYSMHQETAGLTINSQFVSYNFIYGGTMIQLQCSVSIGQAQSHVELARKMNEFKPIFFLLANSIVLENKWK